MLFLAPIAIDSLHDLMNHEHNYCSSKVEKHLHEKEVDCSLHLFKKNDSFLASNLTINKITEIISSAVFVKYNFLKNHYQLSFSSRGPPFLV
jgi:hypothetical protein